MCIHIDDLREQVIKPCLQSLGDYSEGHVHLLTGTALVESFRMGTPPSERQGLGIYQITAIKHCEIWDKYLVQFPDLASQVRGFASQQQFLKNPHSELMGNLGYATAVAWMIYRAKGIDTYQSTDLLRLAQLWSMHFDNGTGCLRTVEAFITGYSTLTTDFTLDATTHKLVA